jgi:hypothetical protein
MHRNQPARSGFPFPRTTVGTRRLSADAGVGIDFDHRGAGIGLGSGLRRAMDGEVDIITGLSSAACFFA